MMKHSAITKRVGGLKMKSSTTPSEITDVYWLLAERKFGTYPESTERCGKWLIFVPVAEIDELWVKIALATEEGRLGGSAKVATSKPNPNARDPNTRVICVYTYDWTDAEDRGRVRQALRELGIQQKIPYKADQDTLAGRYENRGDRKIAKFYE
jgi:hypothetical protein